MSENTSSESPFHPAAQRGRIEIDGFDPADVDEAETTQLDAEAEAYAGRWRRAWWRFRRNRSALLGLAIIAIMALVAVFAQRIELFGVPVQPVSLAPYDPGQSVFMDAKQPPSIAHPFGTTFSGRDILSRVMVGGRYSLSIGVISVFLALGIGIPLGSVAGYFGGWVDEVVMRVVDVLYAFPFLVLAIALIAVLGQGFWNLVLAVVLVSWLSYARIIRGEILSIKEMEYVTAARALGASDARIISRHVVPNALAPVIVQATLSIVTIVLTAAALGFLGLGLEPGTPEWGSMLSSGRQTLIEGQWWVTVFPGVAIFLFVLSINLVGDGIREALDPHGEDAGERGVRR